MTSKGCYQKHHLLLLTFPQRSRAAKLAWLKLWTTNGLEMFEIYHDLPLTPCDFSDASKWKYDTSVREFFVETTTKQTIKQSELLRQQEVSDLGDTLQHLNTTMLPEYLWVMGTLCMARTKEQVRAEPIAAPSAPLALVDESGVTPEPEKMGEKVLTYGLSIPQFLTHICFLSNFLSPLQRRCSPIWSSSWTASMVVWCNVTNFLVQLRSMPGKPLPVKSFSTKTFSIVWYIHGFLLICYPVL